MKGFLRALILMLVLLVSAGIVVFSEEEDYVITTAEELANMRWDGSYVLGNDISLSGNWTPMSFAGTLDGRGHTITGLRVNSSASGGYGLFSWLSGSVSNLNIKDAVIEANSGSIIDVSIIGMCDGAWDFDPLESTAHVFNCHVSGRVEVSSSGFFTCAALIGAEDSSADVDITVNGSEYTAAGLWACRNSEFSGSIEIDSNGGSGYSALILNCSGSTSDADMTVECASPASSAARVYGIYALNGKKSYDCEITGNISHAAHVCVMEFADYCMSKGEVESDELYGIMNSTDCILYGDYRSAGECSDVMYQPIMDSDDEEEPANTCYASYTHAQSSNTDEIRIVNYMGRVSKTDGSISITGGDANVEILGFCNYEKEDEFYSFDHSSFTVNTTAGNIRMYRELATTGNVRCVSDTGEINVTAGEYNSGTVYGTSAGPMSVVGGMLYNCGTVTVECKYGSNENSTAIGVGGANGLNEGSVSAKGVSDGEIGAIGAVGEGSANVGPVTSSNNGKGDASAAGVKGDGGFNSGSVSSSNGCTYVRNPDDPTKEIRVNSSACGAEGNGAYNTGSVSANGSCYNVHAFGAHGGATSVGTVTAIGSWIANADGDAGSATARGGQFASATGADPHASGGKGTSASGRTMYSWYLEYHNTKKCNCSPQPIITTYYNNEPSDSYHNYDLGAMTIYEPKSGGEGVTPPDEQMPEEDEGDLNGFVELGVYSDQSASAEQFYTFIYSFGSISFPSSNETDYTKFYVKGTVENKSSEQKTFRLVLDLPEGFSAYPWAVGKSIDLTCTLGAHEKKPFTKTVYPLYLDTRPESVTFTVSGDLKAAHTVGMMKNPNEGWVHARPTGGTNPNSGTYVPVQIQLNCVEDLKNTSVSSYNSRVAIMSGALSQASYVKEYMYDSYKNLGFTCIEWKESSGAFDVASCFALKKVVVNDVVYPIVYATVRGTYDTEWIGDFNVLSPGGGIVHEDFYNCSISTGQAYIDYCMKYEIPQKSRTVFAAHSRASAVVNLMCQQYNKSGGPTEELTAYCFATPNSTKNPSGDSNVFNYIYIDDLVAYVPQGYGKVGRTYVVGDISADAPSAVANLFQKYCSRAYMNPRNRLAINVLILSGEFGNFIAEHTQYSTGWLCTKATGDSSVGQAHGMENYQSWVEGNGIRGAITYEQALDLYYDYNTYPLLNKVRLAMVPFALENPFALAAAIGLYTHQGYAPVGAVAIRCPVDVEVLDARGNVVAEIKNNEVIAQTSDEMISMAIEDEKLFVLPMNESYTLRITGNGEGTMRVDFALFDINSEHQGNASVWEIPVKSGEVYDLSMLTGDMDVLDVTVTAESGIIYRAVDPANPEQLIYLSENLTTLSDEAFLNDSSLTGTLICPNGLTSIGERAFSGSGLTAVLIPTSVTEIGDTAFDGCEAEIRCYENSRAHEYALEHKISYKLID
ncbi:MAG: leucine-rich repeat domain-containing protein [Clostridia bacterium]|nr:leucine-rich repeat domain-containing protein [Clostridia bacterium]